MDPIAEWLAPYQQFLETAPLLHELERREGERETPADEDPQSYLQGLLGDLDVQSVHTKVHTALFTMADGEVRTLETTPQGAIDYCLRHLRACERVPPALAGKLAEAYLKAGNAGASEVCAAVAYLGGDRSCLTLAMVSAMAIRQQRFEEARILVETSRTLHGGEPHPTYYDALLAIARGRKTEGARLLRTLCAAHPGYRPGWALLLDLLLDEQAWDELAESAGQAVEAHPLEAVFWHRLAVARWRLGKGEESLKAAREALRRAAETVGLPEPVETGIRLTAAQLERLAGSRESAAHLYRSLLDRDLGGEEAHLGLAACHAEAGETERAADVLRRGISRFPGSLETRSFLGRVLFEARRDEEASEVLREVVERDPLRTEDLLLLGLISLRNRRFSEAAELAARVLRQDPGQPVEALVLLGDAYRFSGAREAALEAYREAGRRAPGHPEVLARFKAVGEDPGPV